MKPFPWRAGMRTLATADEPARIIYAVLGTYPTGIRVGDTRVRPDVSAIRHDAQPDPDDGATKGALLEVVREAFDAPAAQVTPYVRWDPVARRTVIDEWMVCLNDADDRSFRGHATEFAALEAAWRAAP